MECKDEVRDLIKQMNDAIGNFREILSRRFVPTDSDIQLISELAKLKMNDRLTQDKIELSIARG